MPSAIDPMRPTISRNELAWLATLDDVESRIVFTQRDDARTRYRAESGPFDTDYLAALPRRDWSLLVHDVDKHLPAMRTLFQQVPFVPDWRIDDLMISFAAPGGGVGPHRDNYDVFLCQGIGIREWHFTTETVEQDPEASDDLLLLDEFEHGHTALARKGDVLYLPPGVAHWGTARRACMTFSIGMRAPDFYADPDLQHEEVSPGYIAPAALARAGNRADRLGCTVTELKQWLQPQAPSDKAIAEIVRSSGPGSLHLHGMTRIAFDDEKVYVNGAARTVGADDVALIARLCAARKLDRRTAGKLDRVTLAWLLSQGTFAQTDPE